MIFLHDTSLLDPTKVITVTDQLSELTSVDKKGKSGKIGENDGTILTLLQVDVVMPIH